MGSPVEGPSHGFTTTLPPMDPDLAPSPLRPNPALRRGSPAVTSPTSATPQPQPQPQSPPRTERRRPVLRVFPPEHVPKPRPDESGSSTQQRPVTASGSGFASASASGTGDGDLVSSNTDGVIRTARSRPLLASQAGVGFAVSSSAHNTPFSPTTEANSSSGLISPGVESSGLGSGSGSGLGRGLPRSMTHGNVIPPMPTNPPPPVPGVGFARSTTQALPSRPALPTSATFGGALGGNNSSRFATGMRSVSAPRPMGAPAEGEDEVDALMRAYISRAPTRYDDQRFALRPGQGLRSRTQTLGTLPPHTTGTTGNDITSPPGMSSGMGSGSGSHQLTGSSMATSLGSQASPGMVASPSPTTPMTSSFPSFPSGGSGSRGRGHGRRTRGSRGSRGSTSSAPKPQPVIEVVWLKRGPGLATVKDPNAPERPTSAPAEEPKSYWSSDTEEEPSLGGRMLNALTRLKARSRGNLRREASSSFSTTQSLSPVNTRDQIPPVPPLPSLTSHTSNTSTTSNPPHSSTPVPPIPEDNDEANQAGGSQRQKGLKKKKSLANLFSKKREE